MSQIQMQESNNLSKTINKSSPSVQVIISLDDVVWVVCGLDILTKCIYLPRNRLHLVMQDVACADEVHTLLATKYAAGEIQAKHAAGMHHLKYAKHGACVGDEEGRQLVQSRAKHLCKL